MATKTYSQLLKELKIDPKQASLRNLVAHVAYSDVSRTKEATEAQIYLAGLSDYYGMRHVWGIFLGICLAVILVFNISLVFSVGLGWLKYTDEWFLRVVLTTNLADIIGLVYVVVKFLFSNQGINKLDSKDIKTQKS